MEWKGMEWNRETEWNGRNENGWNKYSKILEEQYMYIKNKKLGDNKRMDIKRFVKYFCKSEQRDDKYVTH